MSDSGTGPSLPPVSIEDAVINADFDSSLLSILLLGLYTTVYIGTVYIYLTRKMSRNYIVLAAITILYLVNVADTAGDWAVAKMLVGMLGQPKGTAFMFAWNGASWDTLLNNIASLLLSPVADGLLIWRCYNVWDKSLRSISVSLVLLLAEIALFLSIVILACMQNLHPSNSAAIQLDHLVSAALLMTLAATLLTTLLIGYRIHSVARQDGLARKRKPFQNILDLLVQSAAAYALVALVYAVEGVIPFTTETGWKLVVIQDYTAAVFSPIAGMAPTIMVARVALASSNTVVQSSTVHISDLEFQRQSAGLNTFQIQSSRIQAHGGEDRDMRGSTEEHVSEKGGQKELLGEAI